MSVADKLTAMPHDGMFSQITFIQIYAANMEIHFGGVTATI